jgi:DNA-binding MarR family transcriptional regulator
VQAAALEHLLGQESLSLNELAERMRSDAPTLCGVVECLVGAGYVERREDPRDRRRVRLAATEKAREAAPALQDAEARREAALTAGLSRAEVAQLKTLLWRLQQTIDEKGACES